MEQVLTLEEFVARFQEVKDLGWITTHRSGQTGIGKTLEDLLGIKENNIQGPDFGKYELKSARLNSNSMLTLITKSPDTPKANTALRLKYGYASGAYGNDEKVLHSTLNAISFTSIADTGHRLKVTPTADKIYIEDENGLTDVYWSISVLERQMTKKLGTKFLYVKANSRGSGEREEFCFESAYLVEGFSATKIIDLLRNGSIYVDLRIGQYHGGINEGKTHDHGTGFRIKEKDQAALFDKITKIV